MRIKNLIQYWLVVLLLLIGSAVQADVFKWADASGQTHYGDKPPSETSRVEVIDTFECRTHACVEEQERRWRDAMEVNQRMHDWLQQLAAERKRTQGQQDLTTVYVHTYHPLPWWLGRYSDSVSPIHVSPRHPHPPRRARLGWARRQLGKTRMTSHRYLAQPRISPPGSAVHRK